MYKKCGWFLQFLTTQFKKRYPHFRGFPYLTYIPGTQMTPVLIGKDLVLEG